MQLQGENQWVVGSLNYIITCIHLGLIMCESCEQFDSLFPVNERQMPCVVADDITQQTNIITRRVELRIASYS